MERAGGVSVHRQYKNIQCPGIASTTNTNSTRRPGGGAVLSQGGSVQGVCTCCVECRGELDDFGEVWEETGQGYPVEEEEGPQQARSHKQIGLLRPEQAIWLGEQEDKGTEENLGRWEERRWEMRRWGKERRERGGEDGGEMRERREEGGGEEGGNGERKEICYVLHITMISSCWWSCCKLAVMKNRRQQRFAIRGRNGSSFLQYILALSTQANTSDTPAISVVQGFRYTSS